MTGNPTLLYGFFLYLLSEISLLVFYAHTLNMLEFFKI